MGDAQVPLLAGHYNDGEQESLKPESAEINVRRKDQAGVQKRDCINDEVCVTIPISDDLVENLSRKEKAADSFEESADGDLAQMQKALELFSDVPSFGKLPTIDPFFNKTPAVRGMYENLKTVLLLPLMVARLLVMLMILVVGFIATKIALAGWENGLLVLPRWRRKLMFVTRLCGRGILFCFGWVFDRKPIYFPHNLSEDRYAVASDLCDGNDVTGQ